MADSSASWHTNYRQLRQIIAGMGEGVILLDPDRGIVWANEAALEMHGVSSVEELGKDIDQYRERFKLRYRNNHALQAGEYPGERVAAGETFKDVIVEVQSEAAEAPQWVHRVSSLVLTDPEDAPNGFALVLQDASARFEAEERFEKTFNANPAPAVIARLSDLRYIKVNQGFLEMTGYEREQVIGRSVYEVDVLEGAERKEVGVERLMEGRTIPQMEALLRLPLGGTKCVIVAGQPIDIGEEACMLFTFMDMEPRKKAEDALRQSEERFAKSFRLAPLPTFLSNAETGLILDINEAFTNATGYKREQAVGRTPDELRLWDGSATKRRLKEDLAKAGSTRNLDIQMQTKDGSRLDCLLSAETMSIHGESCVLSVLQDITERRRSEMELFEAIEAVMQDASWFSRTVIEKIATMRQPHGSNRQVPALADLTAREREILALICRGMADKQIAAELDVALNTIRNHVATIYGKIDVHRRGEAIVWGRERGLSRSPGKPPARTRAQRP